MVELAKELVSFSLLYVGFPYNPPDSEELKWFEPPRPPYLSVPLLPPRLEVPPPPPRVLGSVESLNSFSFLVCSSPHEKDLGREGD